MPRLMASEHNRSTQTNHQTPQHLAPNTDPIRHKICASVATFMVTGALSTTAFAADSLTFEGGSETTEAINTDTFRWGGAGTDEPQVLPGANVVEFALAGGSKVMVRPSGTEPKIKAYLFAKAPTRAAAEELRTSLGEAAKALLQ